MSEKAPIPVEDILFCDDANKMIVFAPHFFKYKATLEDQAFVMSLMTDDDGRVNAQTYSVNKAKIDARFQEVQHRPVDEQTIITSPPEV